MGQYNEHLHGKTLCKQLALYSLFNIGTQWSGLYILECVLALLQVGYSKLPEPFSTRGIPLSMCWNFDGLLIDDLRSRNNWKIIFL